MLDSEKNRIREENRCIEKDMKYVVIFCMTFYVSYRTF